MSPKKVSRPVDLYLRVSDVRGRSGESYISVKEQEAKARAFCALKGYEVGQVITDEDQTGGKMERPAFDEAMRRALDGESGGIVVAKLDRFARNVRGLLEYVDKLEGAGAVWGCAEPTIDTGDPVFGRFLLTLFGAMAELELGRIRAQWSSVKEHAVTERGVHISRFAPPGYARDESANGISVKTGRERFKIESPLYPHPKYAPIVTEAFRMAADGAAYAAIARYLNEHGLPSGDDDTGSHWKASRMKRLLANRVYLGEARYGEIVNAGAHEPLTDPATWLRAQREQRAVPIQESSTYLLSGLCRCASCRHSMRPQRARGTTVGSYRCATETASGRCPHPSSVSMNRLEGFVYEAWVDRVFGKMQARKAEPVSEANDPILQSALGEAEAKLAEVLADEDKLRSYGVFEQAREAALQDVQTAQSALETRPSSANMDKLIEEGGRKVQQMTEDFMAEGLSPEEVARRLTADMSPGEIKVIRSAMAQEIRAVFVRPAASRSKTAPLADRVHIVWADDPEQIELPRRGEVFTPRPYTW